MEISTQLKESLNDATLNQVRAHKDEEVIKRVHKNSWPIIEPSRDFYDNWHIEMPSANICVKLSFMAT